VPPAAHSLEARGQAALPCVLLSGVTVSETAQADLSLVPNLRWGLPKHGAPFVSHGKHFFIKKKKDF